MSGGGGSGGTKPPNTFTSDQMFDAYYRGFYLGHMDRLREEVFFLSGIKRMIDERLEKIQIVKERAQRELEKIEASRRAKSDEV